MKYMYKRLLAISVLLGVVFALNGCGSSSDLKEMDMSQFTNGYKLIDLCDEDAYLKYGDKLAPLVAEALNPENELRIIKRIPNLIGAIPYEFTNECTEKFKSALDGRWYYYGGIKDGKPDGYGVIMYAPHSSICYVGQFEKGVAKGYGLYLGGSRVIVFEGYIDEVELVDKDSVRVDTYSKADGEVIIPFSYYEMSLEWEGESTPVLSDKPSEVLRLAPKYIGEIKKGLYSGKGILYNPDGTISYEGIFEKGEIAK